MIGFIGAGTLAAAVARGLGDPALFTSLSSTRARELASSVGGEAVVSNRELAQRSSLVILAHSPAALPEVAEDIRDVVRGGAVVSLLARTPLASLRDALPGALVSRAMPNIAAETRSAVTCVSTPDEADPQAVDAARAVFDRVGTVLELPDSVMNLATWLCGSAPAWCSLVIETQVDAAVRLGLERELAERLVLESWRGTAALIAQKKAGAIRGAANTLDSGSSAWLAERTREAFAAAADAATATDISVSERGGAIP